MMFLEWGIMLHKFLHVEELGGKSSKMSSEGRFLRLRRTCPAAQPRDMTNPYHTRYFALK